MLVVLTLPPLAMAQTQTTRPVDSHDLSGVWQFAPGGGGQGPGDNFPPLTGWGQAKYDANKPGYGPRAAPGGNDPILKCDPTGFPRILFQIWPFEILNVPGRILMFFEGQHTIRPIWMDGRKLPADPDPTWYGYSVGRWEGDTLVVETVGFNDRGAPFIPGGGIRTPNAKLTEHVDLLDGGSKLRFTFTWEDPTIFVKPHTYTFTYHKAAADAYAQEYFCDASDPNRGKTAEEPPQRQ